MFAADPTKPVLNMSLLSEEARDRLVRTGVRTKSGLHLAVFNELDQGWARQVHLAGVPVTATHADITKAMAPAFGKVVRLERPHLAGTKVHGTTAVAWAMLPKDAKLPRTVLVHGATMSSLLTADKPAGPNRTPSPTPAATKAPTTKAVAAPATKAPTTAAAKAPTTKQVVPPAPATAATAAAKADPGTTAPVTAATAAPEPAVDTATPATCAPTTTADLPAMPALETATANPPSPADPTTHTTPATADTPTTAAAAEADNAPEAPRLAYPTATVAPPTTSPTAASATATPTTVTATRASDPISPPPARHVLLRLGQLLTPPSRRGRATPSSPPSPYLTASDGEHSPTPAPPRRSERIRTLGSR